MWPHGDYPLIPVGRMVLNRNPENFHTDIEQAAFSPGNFVPGVAASPDKMLQGRIFAYADAHRYRLGANYAQLPVNAPHATTSNNYQRDGAMQFGDNGKGSPNYYPNSFSGPKPDLSTAPPAIAMSGTAGRHAYTHANDHYAQPRALYEKAMSDMDREHLVGNVSGHLKNAQERLQLRQSALFYRVHPEYGTRVAVALGLSVDKVKELAGLSEAGLVEATAQ